MVRSYLIEDRICFDSDSGSGGGVSAPRRTEIRGQDHMLAYITPEEGTILKAFGGSGDPGPMGIPAFYGFGEHDDASSPGQADAGSAQAGDTDTSDAETDDPDTAGPGSTEANDRSDPSGYRGSTGAGFGGYAGSPFGPNQRDNFYATPETTRDNIAGLTRDQYNQMPGYMKAMMNIAPPIGYNIDEFGKVEDYISNPVGLGPLGGFLSGLNNTISGPPEDSKGLVDRGVTTGYGNVDTENYDGGDGFDEFDDIRRRRRNSSGEDTEDAPTVIDDFAVNYLRNPYFAYSGFGNQYNPFGYANSTLVDLLQTRGMTQPSQADTLGLFADPRDFR